MDKERGSILMVPSMSVSLRMTKDKAKENLHSSVATFMRVTSKTTKDKVKASIHSCLAAHMRVTFRTTK